MIWFLKSTDFDLWDVLESGSHVQIELENGMVVSKPRKEYDELDEKKA